MEKLMEKFRGGVIAIAVASIAIVACVCMVSTSANAEDNEYPDDPLTPADAIVTQNVEAADNATFTANFSYAFSSETEGAPALAAQPLSVEATAGVVASGTTKTSVEGTNDTYFSYFNFSFLTEGTSAVVFPRAGEYVYSITRNVTSVTPVAETGKVVWNHDAGANEPYTVNVWVKNKADGSGTEVAGLFFKDKNNTKCLPPVYKSKLITKSDLAIKKLVTGDHGDKTHPFVFTVALTDSDSADNTQVTATRSGDGKMFTFTFTNHVAVKTDPADTDITLKDSQTLTFSGLTTGTTYKVVEKGKDDDPVIEPYTTTAKSTTVNTNGSIVVETSAGATGSGITVQYGTETGQNNAAIVGQGTGNETDVANSLTITPTGFLIDAAPYILLIGIPIIALIIWIVVRKRRATCQF